MATHNDYDDRKQHIDQDAGFASTNTLHKFDWNPVTTFAMSINSTCLSVDLTDRTRRIAVLLNMFFNIFSPSIDILSEHVAQTFQLIIYGPYDFYEQTPWRSHGGFLAIHGEFAILLLCLSVLFLTSQMALARF